MSDNSKQGSGVDQCYPPGDIENGIPVASCTSQLSESQPESTPLPSADRSKEFEKMYSQFNILVLISTFTTALIIAFLSLIAQVVNGPHSLVYEIGMWLAFLASGVHLWVAIVAGRAALLSLPSENKPKTRPELVEKDLVHFLVLCEQLQLLGTIIFAPSALILIPKTFDREWFGISLYIMAVASIFFIFRAGFWKASVLANNFMGVWEMVLKPR
ncbi:hypothetical protein GALMADRAFT_160121 [Galerina marginata CBS 339.88]|uniref:Uncharacterized protein n=1 Tax=Galerina marginata (strain CBS 339.88) TaxID=685588 RepID=A0A067ST92_GALM3|nr:hypothetical protein GALMADRAFT_160121 [Galerina marginata CBS 339.88]